MARTLSPFGFDASHIGALMTVLEWVRKGAPTVRLHALALPLGLTLAYSCECMDWGVACPGALTQGSVAGPWRGRRRGGRRQRQWQWWWWQGLGGAGWGARARCRCRGRWRQHFRGGWRGGGGGPRPRRDLALVRRGR
jgi:hypothetical protein